MSRNSRNRKNKRKKEPQEQNREDYTNDKEPHEQSVGNYNKNREFKEQSNGDYMNDRESREQNRNDYINNKEPSEQSVGDYVNYREYQERNRGDYMKEMEYYEQDVNIQGFNLPDDPMGVCEIGPQTPVQRANKVLDIRRNEAVINRNLPLVNHPCNNDENIFSNKIGNFSKGLPHDNLGQVDIAAYNALILALSTGNPQLFESIPLGGTIQLVNPQSAYVFDLYAQDSHQPRSIVPPAFSSAWQAGEMVELYWQALTRDVPFTQYGTNPLIQQAAAEMNSLSDFRGPKPVTPSTIFRGSSPGNLVGPYISQFLFLDIPYGTTPINQRQITVVNSGENDYMTQYREWLRIQNGSLPNSSNRLDSTRRYIRSGRDLAEWVHVDFTFQATLNAALILLGFGPEALAASNPYRTPAALSNFCICTRSNFPVSACFKTFGGFVTFGAPHILDFVAKASRIALEAIWFQKWLVHRRLRPEEMGGAVQNVLTRASNYPINPELLKSRAVAQTFNKYGTYLLPQAYPEGCPAHPAYPSGHACFAGAGVTILKAFFDESFVIPNPVQASADGLSLTPFSSAPLTIGGELNKLAYNVGFGRAWAGIHYRTDIQEGIRIGEDLAIGLLRDYCATYNENFDGFTFTKFDGTTIHIC